MSIAFWMIGAILVIAGFLAIATESWVLGAVLIFLGGLLAIGGNRAISKQ